MDATLLGRVILLLVAGALFAQDKPLVRLKLEAARLEKSTQDHAGSAAALHLALRDWIESRLPEDKGTLAVKFGYLKSDMQRELREAGLTMPEGAPPDDDDAAWFGHVGIKFTRFPELPDTLFVTAGVTVPRGDDEAVYVYNRTQIHRYHFAPGVQRLDPVAFQPQDFAEEWLTRPWSEMQSRSAPKTEQWHSRLYNDFVMGEYSNVVPCLAKPGRWLIALDITNIREKELPQPVRTYFLVRELGNYRYEMEDVSSSKPQTCPGTGFASDKHPWLSTAELKALRSCRFSHLLWGGRYVALTIGRLSWLPGIKGRFGQRGRHAIRDIRRRP